MFRGLDALPPAVAILFFAVVEVRTLILEPTRQTSGFNVFSVASELTACKLPDILNWPSEQN
jgi:hypothetical protein